jgi:hypothetical protein
MYLRNRVSVADVGGKKRVTDKNHYEKAKGLGQ